MAKVKPKEKGPEVKVPEGPMQAALMELGKVEKELAAARVAVGRVLPAGMEIEAVPVPPVKVEIKAVRQQFEEGKRISGMEVLVNGKTALEVTGVGKFRVVNVDVLGELLHDPKAMEKVGLKYKDVLRGKLEAPAWTKGKKAPGEFNKDEFAIHGVTTVRDADLKPLYEMIPIGMLHWTVDRIEELIADKNYLYAAKLLNQRVPFEGRMHSVLEHILQAPVLEAGEVAERLNAVVAETGLPFKARTEEGKLLVEYTGELKDFSSAAFELQTELKTRDLKLSFSVPLEEVFATSPGGKKFTLAEWQKIEEKRMGKKEADEAKALTDEFLKKGWLGERYSYAVKVTEKGNKAQTDPDLKAVFNVLNKAMSNVQGAVDLDALNVQFKDGEFSLTDAGKALGPLRRAWLGHRMAKANKVLAPVKPFIDNGWLRVGKVYQFEVTEEGKKEAAKADKETSERWTKWKRFDKSGATSLQAIYKFLKYGAVFATGALVGAVIHWGLTPPGPVTAPPGEYEPFYKTPEPANLTLDSTSGKWTLNVNNAPFLMKSVDFGTVPADAHQFATQAALAKELSGNTLYVDLPAKKSDGYKMLDGARDARVKVIADMTDVSANNLKPMAEAYKEHPATLAFIVNDADSAATVMGVAPDALVFVKVTPDASGKVAGAERLKGDGNVAGVVLEPLANRSLADQIKELNRTIGDKPIAVRAGDVSQVFDVQNRTREKVGVIAPVLNLTGADEKKVGDIAKQIGPDWLWHPNLAGIVTGLQNTVKQAMGIAGTLEQARNAANDTAAMAGQLQGNVGNLSGAVNDTLAQVLTPAELQVAQGYMGNTSANMTAAMAEMGSVQTALGQQLVDMAKLQTAMTNISAVLTYLNNRTSLNESDITNLTSMLSAIDLKDVLNQTAANVAKTYLDQATASLQGVKTNVDSMGGYLTGIMSGKNAEEQARIREVINNLANVSANATNAVDGPNGTKALKGTVDKSFKDANTDITAINKDLADVSDQLDKLLADMTTTIVVDDFEGDVANEWKPAGQNVTYEPVSNYVHGQSGMRVKYNITATGAAFAGVYKTLGTPKNWSAYKTIELDVRNASGAGEQLPQMVQLVIWDSAGGISRWNITGISPDFKHYVFDLSKPDESAGGGAKLDKASQIRIIALFDGPTKGAIDADYIIVEK